MKINNAYTAGFGEEFLFEWAGIIIIIIMKINNAYTAGFGEELLFEWAGIMGTHSIYTCILHIYLCIEREVLRICSVHSD